MKRTYLYEEHKKLGAKFTEFGGWEMPVQYDSIINEHNAVRNNAGLFDVSHMGEFVVRGLNSAKYLKKVTVTNVDGLAVGQAKYSLLLNEDGGVVDDLLIYKREKDYILVVNAGNIDKDLKWLKKNILNDVEIKNESESLGMLALQGPKTESIIQKLVNNEIRKLKQFYYVLPDWKTISPKYSLIARTGYTGEDGFEIFISNDGIIDLWKALIDLGVKPCGLGCRDTLRLEAAMPLHGHEINDNITPLEAGLGWTICWDNDFIGKKHLAKQKKDGSDKHLIAFNMLSGIPRAGCEIYFGLEKIGNVSSGTFSPTFKRGIGLGYVEKKLGIDQKVSILIHGQKKDAMVVKKPFYKRNY
ncbi:glycine cleavage system aminomethyltransferase GcvT [Elusimicrobiota bacterium]